MKLIEKMTVMVMASALSYGGAGVFAQDSLGTREFTYADGPVREWGTGLLENYDVAIHLSGYGLEETEVFYLSMPMPEGKGLSDIRLWLSRTLALDGKLNAPDIASHEVVVEDGAVSLRLDEPVRVGEEGLYLGCSFNVTELNDLTKAPVCVSSPGCPGSFFIHSSRKYTKWDDYGLDLALGMSVGLRGVFQESELEVTECLEGNLVAGEEWTPRILVRNLGLSTCERFEYSLEVEGEEIGRASVSLDPPLAPDYGRTREVTLSPIVLDSAGSFGWAASVERVDGVQNTQQIHPACSEVYVWPYAPDRIPLMEEYTGTWCGWCPRGSVGLERMQALYGCRFVAMAYHTDATKDPMATAILPTTPYQGAPWGVLDRCDDIDPYYGHLDFCRSFQDGIGAAWLARTEVRTPVELNGYAWWSDEDMERIVMRSEVTPVRDFNGADLRVGYFIVADGLTGTTAGWLQSNYYSGLDEYKEGDLSELYDAPRYMAGRSYDHVLTYSPDALGSKGSLPADIRALETYEHRAGVDVDMMVNASGESLVQDKARIHVVMAVIDATNNIVLNARYVPIDGYDGVVSAEVEDNQATSVRLYDLQGHPVSLQQAVGQPVIRVSVSSGGEVTSERVMVR